MRIDAHIHVQPPELAGRLAVEAEREPYWALLLGAGSPGQRAPALADASRTLADMDRAGIDRAVIQGEYYRQHESCVAANNRALALQRQYPDRFLAFATVQPSAETGALDEARRCAAAGVAGIGELNPYAQGFALNSPAFLRLAELCIELKLPLLLHVNEPVGRYYPGKATTPLVQYYQLALRYPELRLILAHWGGGLLFYELMPSARRVLRNVWYDTAASPLIYPGNAIFSAALSCIDHRKILYGSDYPLPLYPRMSREPEMASFPEEIATLGLAPPILNDILGGNAARLFGLEPGQPASPGTDSVSASRHAPLNVAIAALTPVVAIAAAWPEARPVLDEYGIPWEDDRVPFWEPLGQAAAAHGLGPQRLACLLDDLNVAVQQHVRNTDREPS